MRAGSDHEASVKQDDFYTAQEISPSLLLESIQDRGQIYEASHNPAPNLPPPPSIIDSDMIVLPKPQQAIASPVPSKPVVISEVYNPFPGVFNQPQIVQPQTVSQRIFRQDSGTSPPISQRGLVNLGQTCYMNCALQMLSHIPQLVNMLVFQDEHQLPINERNPDGTRGIITLEFRRLLISMCSTDHAQGSFQLPAVQSPPVNPTTFYQAHLNCFTRFKPYQQDDAMLCLQAVLNAVIEDLNLISDKPYYPHPPVSIDSNDDLKSTADRTWERFLERIQSPLTNDLIGLYKKSLKCKICRSERVTFEPFLILTLAINIQTFQEVTLQKCLEQDVHMREHMAVCGRCGQMTLHESAMYIYRAPNALFIQLQRFSADGRTKIDHFVNYPVHDMCIDHLIHDPFHKDNENYELISVISHFGSMVAGHYWAYGRNYYEDQWYEFNDQTRRPVLEESVITDNAYILLYIRKNSTPNF